MRLRLSAGLMIVSLFAAAGCQPKEQPTGPVYPPPVAPTPQTRERIQRLAPDALIGEVTAVLPQERLAMIGNVPVQQFKEGDVVTFMGGNEVSIGNGIVIRVGADTLQVRYEPPPPGGRPPAMGDLAIRFGR